MEKKIPLDKLQTFQIICEEIKESIKKFYDKIDVEPVKKTLDGEDLLSILLYISFYIFKKKNRFIIAAADIKHFRVHLKIIEDFTTEKILNSKKIYFLTLIELCVKFIEDLEDFKEESFEEASMNWLRKQRAMIVMSIVGKIRNPY